MKKTFSATFLAFSVVFLCNQAHAEEVREKKDGQPTYAWVESRFYNDAASQSNFLLLGGASRNFNRWFGFSMNTGIASNWSEFQIGPVWTPFRKLEFMTNAGVENFEQKFRPRFSAYLTWRGERLLATAGGEWNDISHLPTAPGLWYETEISWRQTNHFYFGIRGQRPSGIGPMIALGLPRLGLRFFGVWAPLPIDPWFPSQPSPDRVIGGASFIF